MTPDEPVCTGDPTDGCAADPMLGECPACGYVTHDIARATDDAHDDLCCGTAAACSMPAGDLCVTHPREDASMRYENLGPVANPDGSPTDLTRAMLAGTGRDPVEFALGVTRDEPVTDDEIAEDVIAVGPDGVPDPLAEMRDDDGTLPSYSWPGAYPLIYVTRDGLVVCPVCANDPDTSDPVVASDVYWEGAPLTCDDCGTDVESAYGDPDDDDDWAAIERAADDAVLS